MTIWSRLATGGMVATGIVWFAADSKLITLPPKVGQSFEIAWLVLWGLSILLDRPSSSEGPSIPEPSPALSALLVIVPTGAVATLLTARRAQATSEYVLPAVIAITTCFLAVITFRFATKNKEAIGETRFETISTDDETTRLG